MGSIPSDGITTPITKNDALRDHSAIYEWLWLLKISDEIKYFRSLEVMRTSNPHASDTFLIIDKS